MKQILVVFLDKEGNRKKLIYPKLINTIKNRFFSTMREIMR